MKITRPDLLLQGFLFCLAVALAFFSRFALLARLRRRLPNTRGDLATVYPYLEVHYLRNRRQARTPSLDLLALCSLLSPWLVLLVALGVFGP